MRKRILSFLIALVLLLGAVPITAQKADAAATYSVDKAMDYAAKHWNDGKGLCAEFVSRCVIAGGLNMKVFAGTGDCLRGIEKASGLQHEVLKLDKNGYATKALNGDHLAAGDAVIQYCPNCQIKPNLKPHALFCAGYDSKGIAIFYAHNGAMNKGYYRLDRVSTHPDCKNLQGWVVRLSTLDTPKQTDSVTFSNHTSSSYDSYALVEYNIAYTGNRPTTQGIIWGPSMSEMVHKLEYPTGTNGNPFTVTNDLRNLDNNRTYYYQAYAIQNGKTITDSIRTFTTAKLSKTLSIAIDETCGYILTINPNNELYLYDSATATEAYGYLAPRSSEYSLFATRSVVLSNAKARYYCIDSYGNTAWVGFLIYSNAMKMPETVHNYTNTVVAPTYTSQGYTLHQCACGNSYKDNYTPALSNPKPTPTPSTHSVFKDVKVGAYYYEAVDWAVKNGITSGATKDTFNPSGVCTRAQVVTFLWRAAGQPEPKSTVNPFTDIQREKYYYKAVLWAAERGITSGITKTTFGPNDSCTRAQVVSFLWRAAGQPEPKSLRNPFNDVASNKYYFKPVLWAVEKGITSGFSANIFGPTRTCTRAQIVTFLYRGNGSINWDALNAKPPIEQTPPSSNLYVPGVSVDNAIRYFNEVCLNDGYSYDGYIPEIIKWTKPIYYKLNGSPTSKDLQVINSFVTWLNTVPGFPGMYETKDNNTANLQFHFCSNSEMINILGDDFTNVKVGSQYWYNNGATSKGVICFRNDMSQYERNYKILNAIYLGLGTVKYTDLRPDSILSNDQLNPQSLSAVDKLIIKLLYHPNIKCGMTSKQCETVIRNIYY